MPLIDITRTLVSGTAVWPGDTPFRLQRNLRLAQGDSVNLTSLTLSAHTGTHVDAPYHFMEEGATVDAMPLDLYWGPAQVVTVSKTGGPLHPDDFASYDLTLAPRLLVHSPAGDLDQSRFPQEFVYPSPALAEHLARAGVVLFGSDAPSMDAEDSKTLEGHHALQAQGIAILEWLDLRRAPDGLYELVALPLKIANGDGSPVRAALRNL
ncbi:MAG: cyclase family protein [Chloroflexota bacterium]